MLFMRVMILLFTIILCILSAPNDGRADAVSSIAADVVSVYDGDSIIVDAHPWPGMTIRISVRVRGIDAAEIKGKCQAEKKAALIARDRVTELAQGGILLKNVSHGKYAGRVVADVVSGAGSLAEMMIKEGLARPYDGGKRASWCD